MKWKFLLHKNHHLVFPTIKRDYGQSVNLSSNQLEAKDYMSLFQEFISSFNIKDVSRYPNIDSLAHEIATLKQINSSKFLLSPGSDCFILTLLSGMVHHKSKIILNIPNYNSYTNYASQLDLDVLSVSYLLQPEKKIIKSYEKYIKLYPNSLVIITNPDNVIGASLSHKAIEKIIKTAYDYNCLVLIDAAYADFTEFNFYELSNAFENVVVLQTLSKSYGMAGLRLAYIIGANDLISAWKKTGIERGCNIISLLYYRFCLLKPKQVSRVINKIIIYRSQLIELIKTYRKSWRVFESKANFISFCVSSENEARHVINLFHINGFIIKYLNEEGMPDFLIRITVASDKILIKKIASIITNYVEKDEQ